MGGTLYTFNGGGTTGNWGTAASWTTDPTGSTSVNSRVPVTGDVLVVTNSYLLSLTADVTLTSLAVTVQRGGVLDMSTYKFTGTLDSLSGKGTLRIGAPYFPTVITNNFDDANTGTVEFYNWPSTPSIIPAAGIQYNNLRFLNTSGTAYTARLDNDLTLTGSLTLTRTNTGVFPAGSTYASAAAAAAGAGVSFMFGNAAASRTLNILGDVNIGQGTLMGIATANATHILNVSGSFVNNGTVNLHGSSGSDVQVAQLVFKSTADANFACNGDTDLDILRVDKGVDSQVLLNVTGTGGLRGNIQGNLRLNHVGAIDFLQLVNGITKLGNNIYLAKISNDLSNGFSLGSTTNSPTLWIDGATVVNDNEPLIAVYGIYRISRGQFTDNYDAGMVVREDGQVLIEGGITKVNKFRPSRTSANHRGSFIITGGLFECTGTTGTSVDDKFSRFAVPYVTQGFRMTGGTIRTQAPNANGADGLFHIGVNPNNAVVTGGTVEIILPATATNGKILTTAPLWNLTIKKSGAAGASTAVLATMPFEPAFAANATLNAQPITVQNNFILDATNPTTFDAAGLNVTIQGSFTIGTGCTYLPNPIPATPTQTTIFNGGQNQLLTVDGTIGATAGLGTFNNWTVDKVAGTLTLAGAVANYYTPSGTTLSLLRGVLNDAGKTVFVQGNILNSASHQSGTGGSITMNGITPQTIGGNGNGVFGNLKINVPTASIAAGSVAVSLAANIAVSNILTLSSLHIFSIGAYRLSLTNISPNAIGPSGAFTSQRMVQTAGNASDLGLQKTYGPGTAQSFTFPVGTGTKFTPATIAITSLGSLDKFGQVSVSPANLRNPFATGSNNALKYFWKVRSINFNYAALPSNAVDMNFTMLNTDAVGTIGNYVGGRYLPTAWNTAYSTNIIDLGTGSSRIDFTGMNNFAGEFTAGDNTTPVVAFGPVTAFYSRANGNWETNTTWSTTSNSGAAVPAGAVAGVNFPGPGNPVFIGLPSASLFHTVTVTANAAKAGSLVIDRGSVLDIGVTGSGVPANAHNFGELPDSKVGGSGRLRISSNTATATFPGGDFGTFIQYGGGTVEYYTTGAQDFTVPTTSGTLTLNQYRNLWLGAASGRTITLPNQDLRIYAQLRSGTNSGTGTALLSAAAAGNLRVDSLLNVQNGVFRLQNTTVRSLAIDTDVKVDAGATFDVLNNAALTHNVTVGGSLTNNGTLNFSAGTGLAALTFTGSQNASITGPTGVSTNLSTLTVNKGTGRTATLTVDVAGTLTTPTNSWLTLTNGTLRYAKGTGTLTIHDAATPYLITDNAGLTVDAPGANVTIATAVNTASDVRLAGEIRVLQGTLSVGTNSTTAGNDLEYASAGSPTLRVASGGTLYVNGQVRRTVNNLDGSLRYEQTGGTVNIDGVGANALLNNERGLFEVQGPGSFFRMLGGTLNLHRSNQKSPITTADLYLTPDSTVVTAGTVRLGNTAAGVGNVVISVNSKVPLYDLIVESAADASNTNTGLLAAPYALNLKGSLTIGAVGTPNANTYFNANGIAVNIDQNLNNYNNSTSTSLVPGAGVGGFLPSTAAQTTTFTGKGPALQQLVSAASNLTNFGALVLNNAQATGTLQLGGNARVNGVLTLTKGTLEDNGNLITAVGQVLNSAVHSSTLAGGALVLGGATNQAVGGNGLGKYGNLTLNNLTGATATASLEVTKVLALNSGVLFIGSNLLNLSSTSAAAVTTTATLDNGHCIRTNGIVADLGVRKSYPAGASNFTFPIGAAVVTKYTPVTMNVTSSATLGTITVQPIAIPHPSTTDPANKELSYYWKVGSTGLSTPVVTQVFAYALADVNGTEANYKLGRFLSGAWTPVGGIAASVVNTTNHTLTNTGATYIDGDYTGGEPSEFGVVPTFYSRTATAGLPAGAPWDQASSWTLTAGGSGPSASSYPTLASPVVILPGHLITPRNAASPGQGAASLVLNGTLDLGTNLANNFSTVSGTGTLRIGSAIFPAGNFASFVAANTGTVDYTGAVQLPARDTYNNLTFSGGNTKQLTNLDLILNGALNVAVNTTVNNPTSQNITLFSGTSGATITGALNLNDGNLTTTASLATSGTLTLGAGKVSVGTTATNSGLITLGSGPFTVGTAFANTGSVDATQGVGSVTVGTTFNNGGTYGAGVGDLVVNGDFNNTGNFGAATGQVNVNGNFTNAGSYVANASNIVHVNGDFVNTATGSFSAGTSNIVLRGNFTNNNGVLFDPGSAPAGSLVQFITNTNRFVTGNTSFYDLQKLGSSALTFGTNTNVTVTDLLTIQNSVIFTGINGNTNTLYLTNPAIQPIVGNTLSSFIAGRLAMTLPDAANAIRVFPVGAGQRYRPVTIKPLGASTNAQVLVEIINGAAPNANNVGNVDPATLQNIATTRYYRIQLLSGTLNQPTVQLSFNTDVVDETVNVPGNLRVARSNGNAGQWTSTGGSGVYSPDYPRGYATSAATTIDGTSFFVLGSTNKVDNPLSGSAPLPVELIAFSAIRQGSAVQVAWATASEKNSAYFVVERSADSRTFEALARVEAQGSSTARHDYGTLDRSPLGGTSYYRLRQVDRDGTVTYTNVVAVRFDSKTGTPTLVAYPNPATGTGFQLAATNLTGATGTVRVFDNVGRLVCTQAVAAGTAEVTVQPAQPLASGMYFATWTTTDGVKLTTKVSVE